MKKDFRMLTHAALSSAPAAFCIIQILLNHWAVFLWGKVFLPERYL
jgi:hypothetical protein